MSQNDTLKIQMNLAYDDGMPDEIYALTRDLQNALLESSDVNDATIPVNEEQPMTRAKGEMSMLGQVMLEVLPTAIPAVIVFVQAWLLRQKDQTIEITIGDNKMIVPHDADPDKIEALASLLRDGGGS